MLGTYSVRKSTGAGYSTYKWEIEITWEEIFALISPHLLNHPHDDTVNSKLAYVIFAKLEKGYSSVELND